MLNRPGGPHCLNRWPATSKCPVRHNPATILYLNAEAKSDQGSIHLRPRPTTLLRAGRKSAQIRLAMSDDQHITEHVIDDRGEAAHFHGRTRIRNKVQELLKRVDQGVSPGTCVLIEGAPGAGKTALLQKIVSEAPENWLVLHLKPGDLGDKERMSNILGWDYVTVRQKSWDFTPKGIGRSGSKILAGLPRTMDVINAFARKEHSTLLFVLDEIQRISKIERTDTRQEVADTMEALINGELSGKIVLLAGGLEHSSQAIRDVGASRLRGGATERIGRLSEKSTRAVVGGWLSDIDDLEEHLPNAIEVIARESHGWPQHIVALCSGVREFVKRSESGIKILPGETPLSRGCQYMRSFYAERCVAIHPDAAALLGCAIGMHPPGKPWSEIVLTRLFQKLEAIGGPPAKEVLMAALHKGVLTRHPFGWRITIPSLETYLVRQFERYKTVQQDMANAMHDMAADMSRL